MTSNDAAKAVPAWPVMTAFVLGPTRCRRRERVRIDICNVTVDFHDPHVRALEALSLTIEEGEHVALLGPSGSGKTTLLRLLLGAVNPSMGSIEIGGFNPFGHSQEVSRLRRRTGWVRQRDDLVTGLTGRTNALMATSPDWRLGDWLAVLCGRVPRRHADALRELALRHGIEACLTSRVENLSGGQRQRVALVRALLTQPDLLLADEPTSGLDPRNAELVVNGMVDDSRTVVLATHDLSVARRFSRVIALRDGQLTYDGPVPGGEILTRVYRLSEHQAPA